MKIQTTKTKRVINAIETKHHKVVAFDECEFPVKRRITEEVVDGKTVPCKRDIIEGAPDGYLDTYPHCVASEDGKQLIVQLTPCEARVYRVGEEMPLRYYAAMVDVLEQCKTSFDLLNIDETVTGAWEGVEEKEIKVKDTAKVAVVK